MDLECLYLFLSSQYFSNSRSLFAASMSCLTIFLGFSGWYMHTTSLRLTMLLFGYCVSRDFPKLAMTFLLCFLMVSLIAYCFGIFLSISSMISLSEFRLSLTTEPSSILPCDGFLSVWVVSAGVRLSLDLDYLRYLLFLMSL
jgi:hypothetical protein